jgi:histidinol-phosphate/aromatic aminotransferase/cobyric acid decarboxylase-like protein
VNGPAESAAVAALRDTSGWTETIVEETVSNRTRMEAQLTQRGLRPVPSDANFLLVPLRGADPRQVNRGLVARGVAARPFPDLPGIGGALRVTIGPWEMMERFLQALDETLSDPEITP